MYEKLVGIDGFRKGLDLYFEVCGDTRNAANGQVYDGMMEYFSFLSILLSSFFSHMIFLGLSLSTLRVLLVLVCSTEYCSQHRV